MLFWKGTSVTVNMDYRQLALVLFLSDDAVEKKRGRIIIFLEWRESTVKNFVVARSRIAKEMKTLMSFMCVMCVSHTSECSISLPCQLSYSKVSCQVRFTAIHHRRVTQVHAQSCHSSLFTSDGASVLHIPSKLYKALVNIIWNSPVKCL